MKHRWISRRRVIGMLGVTVATPLVAACGAAAPAAKPPADAKPAGDAKPATPPAQTQAAPAKPAAQGATTVRVALNGRPEKANGMKGVT